MKPAYLTLAAGLATAIGLSPSAQAAKHSPDPGYFQESYDEEAMGHDQEALAALDKLSSEKNGSYVAFLRKGWLQYRLGKNALAIEDYSKAVALAPKAIEPRLGILLPLMAEKQWSPAEKHARDILKLDRETTSRLSVWLSSSTTKTSSPNPKPFTKSW